MIQLTTLSEQRGAWHAIRPMLGTASELHVIRQQGLAQRLRGHYGYYAIRGNKNRAWSFLRLVTRAWKTWLERRSDKAGMGWRRYRAILKRFPLPAPVAASQQKS